MDIWTVINNVSREKEKKKKLGKIMLNGIYLKRYLNLILLSLQQERCPAFLPILELKFCLEEVFEGIEYLGSIRQFL